ncbi:N-acetylmuramoyl-L-alanine amidase [Flavobacterium sp. NRK F7]|uniref:N-acetylmuramoyl-L-alanine amidase family protein n=1 Tax=Flavobacterium sp. NRK F7 TaxID=2954930 RepID=UPI002091BEA7|nr:N-acetylmuramoyl-L-alanine amidase [Flavobacterium sp. NRK F7]MCO6163564.1 N-acetylmuramoyl-L-alanine amidase [Flavobacterium sp. NRK F7]
MRKETCYTPQLKFNLKVLVITVLFLSMSTVVAQSKTKFKVVLDAGHGGKDYGNVHHGYIEKKIALAVTLKVGEYLSKDSDFDFFYSRKTDVFVELKDRAIQANKQDANLFVSIHCNAAKNYSAFGTETFVMGLSRSSTNLEVAKNENSVILLEEDYKENYKGFDPNRPESLIGLKILQEEYLNQSIELAAFVEDNFKDNLGKKSRGVKQAPLWVLDASYMPGVLIEIGFLSNKVEGEYLNTEKGQNEVAKAIADAIFSYKKQYYKTSSGTKPVVTETVKIEETPSVVKEDPVQAIIENVKNGIQFKVQLSASSTKIATSPSNFKGLNGVHVEQSGKIYKYLFGSEDSYELAQNKLTEAKNKGFESAFIVAYKDGVKINLSDAIK